MNNRTAHDELSNTSVQSVLQVTASYLQDLNNVIKGLEHILLEFNDLEGNHPQTSKGLQRIDFLSQAVNETGQLLERVAIELPPDLETCPEATLDPVKLESLRNLLIPSLEVTPTATSSTGFLRVDLF